MCVNCLYFSYIWITFIVLITDNDNKYLIIKNSYYNSLTTRHVKRTHTITAFTQNIRTHSHNNLSVVCIYSNQNFFPPSSSNFGSRPTWVVEVVLPPAGALVVIAGQAIVEALLADDHHSFLFLLDVALPQISHDLTADCWLQGK